MTKRYTAFKEMLNYDEITNFLTVFTKTRRLSYLQSTGSNLYRHNHILTMLLNIIPSVNCPTTFGVQLQIHARVLYVSSSIANVTESP
jgi:hypothetical protein